MLLSESEQLVFETLNYQPLAGSSCLASNTAGLQLVGGDASCFAAARAALLKLAQEGSWEKYYGLDYVIGAFFVLGSKYSPDEMVEVVNSLPKCFIPNVIAAIPAFFQRSRIDGKYNFGVAPAKQCVDFIAAMKEDEDPEIRKSARRVYNWLV